MVTKTIDSIRTSLTRIQPILLWLIALWFAYRLGINGVRKLDPDGFWTNAFQRWGYPNWFRTFYWSSRISWGINFIDSKN